MRILFLNAITVILNLIIREVNGQQQSTDNPKIRKEFESNRNNLGKL